MVGHIADGLGAGRAHGVHQAHPVDGAALDDLFHHPVHELGVGPHGIIGAQVDVQALLLGVLGQAVHVGDVGVVIPLQLILALQHADGKADGDAPHADVGGQVKVLLQAANTGGDPGVFAAVGDLGDGIGVLLGVTGHTGLDLRDAHLVQQLGDGYLILFGKDHAGLLLAVAQGAVAQGEVRAESHVFGDLRKCVKGTHGCHGTHNVHWLLSQYLPSQ